MFTRFWVASLALTLAAATSEPLNYKDCRGFKDSVSINKPLEGEGRRGEREGGSWERIFERD